MMAACFEVVAQLGAGAVDLVAAHEVQLHAVGEGFGEVVDSQLALGAEAQASRQAHGRRGQWFADVGGRDPFPGADQRVPGAFRAYARCTVLMPLATLPTHPRYCLFTPACRCLP